MGAPAIKALRPNLLGTCITKRKASYQGLCYTPPSSIQAAAETRLCLLTQRSDTDKRKQRRTNLLPGSWISKDKHLGKTEGLKLENGRAKYKVRTLEAVVRA